MVWQNHNRQATIQEIAYLTCRGGWPLATLLDGDIALDQAFDYVDSVVERDIQRVDGIRRNSERARLLLRLRNPPHTRSLSGGHSKPQ